MSILIQNGNIITKNTVLKNSAVLINGDKIVSAGKVSAGKHSLEIDAKGCYVSPGFIDLHIHGEPKRILSSESKYGTTSLVIALSCGRLDNIYKDVANIKSLLAEGYVGPNILGLHLEGPYINKKMAGAQNKKYIRKPDARELRKIISKCGSLLKIMTIAPELKGADRIIKVLNRNSIIASLGHSDATYKEALKGIDLGIRHATHIFNCMRPIDRREPGAAAACLLDKRNTVEAIPDLIHVQGALIKLLIKLKDINKIVLITDSVRSLQAVGVKKEGNVYRFKDGRIAGSSLTMIDALKNVVKYLKLSLLDAIKFVTINPAVVLGIQGKKGSIDIGKDADIVIFDKHFDVKLTMVRGKIVYRKKGFSICAA